MKIIENSVLKGTTKSDERKHKSDKEKSSRYVLEIYQNKHLMEILFQTKCIHGSAYSWISVIQLLSFPTLTVRLNGGTCVSVCLSVRLF